MRTFTGKLILDHKYTDDPQIKYERAHEKRRLKAYLKGKKYFFHGRELMGGMVWFPKRFLVEVNEN